MTNIVFTTTMQLILAAVNQFAERADLSIPLPIQQKDVTLARIREGTNGWCLMVVGDRYKFTWDMTGDLRGRIGSYDDNRFSAVTMNKHQVLPSLTNVPSLIITSEALAIAERCLQRLGYDKVIQYRVPPIVRQYTYRTSLEQVPEPVPLFGIRWPPRSEDAWEPYIFEIQVSGLTKKVTSFSQLTFEGTIIDLRQFMTNGPPDIHSEATNVSPTTSRPP